MAEATAERKRRQRSRLRRLRRWLLADLGQTNPPPGKGSDPAGDSSSLPTARLVLSTVEALDASGNVVTFQASSLPLGADCDVRVHYQDGIALRAGGDVGDRARRAEFVTFDPKPLLD